MNKILLTLTFLILNIMMIGLVYVIGYQNTIINPQDKAEEYCKDYDGVKSISKESMLGVTVLCNKQAGQRSFLFFTWDTYEGTRLEKDGNVIKDTLSSYIIYPVTVLVLIEFVGIFFTKENNKEVKQNDQRKD